MGRGIGVILILLYGLSGNGQIKTKLTEQQTWYDQGKSLQQQKEYAAAMNAFKRAEPIALQQHDTIVVMNTWSRMAMCLIALEDFQHAEQYYRNTLVWELAHHDSVRIAKAYNNVGYAKHYLSQLDSCLFYYHKALSIYRALGYKELPQFIKNIGLVYQVQGNVAAAANHLFESADMFEVQGDKAEVASIYNILGSMYSESGYDSLSLHYHNKSLQIRRSLGDTMAIAQSLNNLANIVKTVYGGDSALSVLRASLRMADDHGNKRLRSAVLNNIGEILFDKGKPDSSRALYLQSLALKRELKDQFGIAYTIHNIARIALQENNKAEAERLVVEGLAIARQIKASRLLVKFYGIYAYLLTNRQDFKQATRYYQLHLALKDSLLNELKLKAFSEAEVKFRTNNLEEEVAWLRPLGYKVVVLTLQAENQEERLKVQHTINWAMGIGVVMMFIVVLLVRRANIQRRKYNELLALKNIEILHRVRNNLGVLIAVFSDQSRMTNDEALKTILKQNENRIKTIRHLNDRLSSEPADDLSAKIYFEGVIDDLLFTANYAKSKCRIEVDNIKLDAEKALYIGLVINELITNAIKHGHSEQADTFLEVRLKKHTGYLELNVCDNGPGIKNEQPSGQTGSYGMNLLYKLVKEQLEGEVYYRYENGAMFTIKIPL